MATSSNAKKPAQTEAAVVSPHRSKRVLVAKEEMVEAVNINEAIPMSIFKKAMGIEDEIGKVNKGGRDVSNFSFKDPSSFSSSQQQPLILGDWNDFKEFELLLEGGGGDASRLKSDADNAKNSEKNASSQEQLLPEVVVDLEELRLQKEREWRERERADHLDVLQKYRDLREEHSLSNWERHSIEWHRIEAIIAKKSGKATKDLLMARLGEYRTIVEDNDLIQEALLLMEQQNINFWKEGLKIGNDLLGLSFQMPKGGPRQIERLHYNEIGASKKKKKKLWNEPEELSKEFGLVLDSIDPFYKREGGYLETVGKNAETISGELAKKYLERLEKLKSDEVKLLTENNDAKKPSSSRSNGGGLIGQDSAKIQQAEKASALSQGLHLLSSSNRLFFEVPLDQISTSVVTIHNRGTVSISFEWIQIQKENPLHTKVLLDGVRRFFFIYTKGVILPGTAFDFPIVFKSAKNGIFTESWKFKTSPALPENEEISITLQGFAVEKDILSEKRENVDKLLHSRRAKHLAKEIISIVLDRVFSTQPKHTLPYIDPNKGIFEERNRALKLFYNPIIYGKINTLANTVYHSLPDKDLTRVWNGSVSNLYDSIKLIQPNDLQATFISNLNQFVNESTTEGESAHTLMTVFCNEVLVTISGRISEISEELRKKLNLPAKNLNFSDPEPAQEEDQDPNKKGGLPPSSQDPKKAPAKPVAVPEVKKVVPVLVPVKQADPKKAGGPGTTAKKGEEEEALQTTPKTRKKLNSSKGWSHDRRVSEAQYSSQLFDMVRATVVQQIDKFVTVFEESQKI